MPPHAPQPLQPPAIEVAAVLEAVAVAAYATDPEGRVVAWNQAAEELFGIPAADAIGRPLDRLPIGWDRDAIRQAMLAAPADVRTIDRLLLRDRRGTARILTVGIRPRPDENPGSVWTCSEPHGPGGDPIARKLAALGGLAAGIAHEINTPMQFIGDNARFLSEAIAGLAGAVAELQAALAKAAPEAAQGLSERHDLGYLLAEAPKAVAQTLDGIQRVTEIVKAMKEFAHPGSDELVPTDLNHAIASTLTLSRNVWKYVAELRLELDPGLPLVPVIPGAFQQVILNLVVNAAHAIEDHLGRSAAPSSGAYPVGRGGITVRSSWHDGYAAIEIVDTGCGMSAEVRNRLFEPFFTTKEPGRGTGQGLALVHAEVVGRLHGHIEVESVPGAGTLFRLTIPGPRPVSPTGRP